MSSVLIAGPKNVQEEIIKELHDLKVLHIVDYSKSDRADIGTPHESASKLSETLVKVRSLISALNIKKEASKLEIKRGMLEIGSNVKKITEQLNLNLEEIKRIDGIISKNWAARQELAMFGDVNINIDDLGEYKSIVHFAGFLKNEDRVATVKTELSIITDKFKLLFGQTPGKYFIVLFIDAKSKENASLVLQKNGFSPITFSNIQEMKGTASDNLERLEREIRNLEKQKEEAQSSIVNLSSEYGEFLAASEVFLAQQLEKAEAPLKFASTQSSFLIKGWIPSDDLHKSIDRLNKAGKGKIFIEFEPAKSHSQAPVKFRHPKAVKPFEFFIDLYNMPTYSEIDPTFFIFLTFPILFGMMLGDVGYGIVGVMLFWILKKKMPSAKNFFNIIILSSLVTIIFGFLFGELFGFEFIHPLISRQHDMITLMIIAVAIGVVHVNLGLVIGFINELKHHGIMHAIYAKAGWIVLEIGVAMAALSYLKIIPISLLFGLAFLFISVIMLFKGEGVRALLELPSIFTNIMSYIRLMAIGVSSVILALIINDSAKESFHKGGLFVLMGVLILIIGHTVNILLGWLGSFLHSLRLHYVEFFSKFFSGGGKKYQPFGSRDDE